MAERRNMKVKMSLSSVSCYLFILTLLDVAVKSQMSSNSNNNAFLQGSNDVRYLVDTIPVSMHKEFSSSTGTRVQNVEESTMFSSKAHLKFEPSLLDFKERHLGVPHHEKVTILNLNSNKTIHMSSISGNTVHFHSSFFEDKIIPPLGNTSFNVVFLGREEGEIESSLFIHTSEGSFKYQVKGASIQSPYRIRPLSGVRLPLNASYSPLINVHNPHSQPLQLVEVYSSGGEFHLELPSGELEGPKHLWEIPAFLTKPIIRVRFHARAQKNHTAYIRLKVNNSEEVLVVPLEVEVGGACGLYSPDDVLDFGIGGSQDPPKQLKLWLRNSWKKPIRVQNVISMPVSKAVKIDFQPVKVPPDVTTSTQVAVITFDWKTALETGHSSGKVVVKSKQGGQKLVIPYTSTVLAGGLSYDSQVTRFRSDCAQIPARPFHLTNNYKVPVAITNANLSKDASKHFEVSKFKPQILQPGQSAKLLEIGVIRGTTISPDLKLESILVVHTNISALAVPLLCYNGKLVKVILSARNETELELGTVGSETEKKVYFALINENPVAVGLRQWGTDLPLANINLVAIESGNLSSLFSKLDWQNSTTQEKSIGPGQYGVFLLVVRSGGEVGEAHGKVWVHTEYERIDINAHMRIEHGSLQVSPDPIVFDDCFPGRICSHKLLVQSLFSVAMAVTGVDSIPSDPRLRYIPATPPILAPSGTSHLGELSWDAEALMSRDNYLGISQNASAGSTRWLDTLELPTHTRDYDLSLLATRYEQYLNLSSHILNLSLRLDTTEVRDHSFGVRVRLSWPNLVIPLGLLQFPLTQVGNTTFKEITVSNPGSRYSLVVQITMENFYPLADGLVDSIPEGLRPSCTQCSQSNPNVFLLEAGQTDNVSHLNGINTHKETLTYLLPPLTNLTLRVGFAPTSAQLASALLIIRNNLTVLETLQMYGSGAYAQFKFGNRKPGSATPLVFELAEKHLKDCEREKQRKFPAPNLTVKRSFTARNTGALPISVHGFHISGLPCEGYGFRVLNCEPFFLAPNATRKVDIAFTPDFTLARVQRTLSVLTSEGDYGDGKGAANYTLVATLPPYLLASCSTVLARPTWEPLLYYSAVTFMVFLLLCVLAAAFLESDRALKCALVAMSRDNSTVQPVLDLRLVGAGVGIGNGSPSNSSPPVTKNAEVTSEAPWSPPHSQNTSCIVPEQEVVKERRKSESESVAAVFSNSGNKSNKKKIEKEKVLVNKRLSEPLESCTESSQPKDSWTNVFKGSLIESHPNKPSNKTSSSSSSSSCGTDSGSFPIPSPAKLLDKGDSSKCTQVSNKDQTNVSKVVPTQRVVDNKRRFGGTKKNSPSNSGCYHKVVTRENSGCTSASGAVEDAETSSTTTESSTHDDGDKEVEATMSKQISAMPDSTNSTNHKSRRPRNKITNDMNNDVVKHNAPTERSGGSASSIEPEWDEDDRNGRDSYDHKRKTHPNGRNGRKQNNRNAKTNDPNNPANIGRNRNGNNGNKQQNKNKEKQMLARKRSNDKSVPSNKGLLSIFDTTAVPPPPPAVWGESRASFSDVVARSDSYSSVLAPRHSSDNNSMNFGQNTAPTTSSGPTPLGPIGPRKSSPNNIWSNWTESNETILAPPSTSSLFMDSVTPATNQSVQPGGFGVWSEPNILLKMLQAEEQRRIAEEEYQRRTTFQDSWPAVNSLWDPLYTPTTGNPTTRPLESATVNGSLMWGSDVWAPTPPPSAPWAPPGLAPRPPLPRRDEQHVIPNPANDVEHGLEYDPFRSLSNIWSPHTTNIWKPPTSK